jgi:putative two-component system response regulator
LPGLLAGYESVVLRLDVAAARVLVLEDEPDLATLLEMQLRAAGFAEVLAVHDARGLAEVFDSFRPDIVLTDLHMPGASGFDVISTLRRIAVREYLPIVVLTADIERETKLRALDAGATDFLQKPVDSTELQLRLNNLLETRTLYRALREQNSRLEQRVRARTRDLETAKLEILERLARAAEYRDDATGQHAQRVGDTAALIAEALEMPEAQVSLLRRAAPLHDVGKIGVPDAILLKPGSLTPAEFEVMKRHTHIGARLLAESIAPQLRLAELIALTHDERWDGRGYGGMRGEEIPLIGRIVAVADAFDAMTHDRPYRPAMEMEEALSRIGSEAGTHFCPTTATVFTSLADKLERAY